MFETLNSTIFKFSNSRIWNLEASKRRVLELLKRRILKLWMLGTYYLHNHFWWKYVPELYEYKIWCEYEVDDNFTCHLDGNYDWRCTACHQYGCSAELIGDWKDSDADVIFPKFFDIAGKLSNLFSRFKFSQLICICILLVLKFQIIWLSQCRDFV